MSRTQKKAKAKVAEALPDGSLIFINVDRLYSTEAHKFLVAAPARLCLYRLDGEWIDPVSRETAQAWSRGVNVEIIMSNGLIYVARRSEFERSGFGPVAGKQNGRPRRTETLACPVNVRMTLQEREFITKIGGGSPSAGMRRLIKSHMQHETPAGGGENNTGPEI